MGRWLMGPFVAGPGQWVRTRGVIVQAGWGIDHTACESRYAATTEAGTLPRSLMVNPFSRAEKRTSALLVESGPGEPAAVVSTARTRAEALVFAALSAARFLPTGCFVSAATFS